MTQINANSELKSVTLSGWKWREAGESSWNKCKHDNPISEIYVDLLDADMIPDPFIDRNERKVQWVAEKDWEYCVEFEVEDLDAEHHDLVFEGLDTVATVYLNNKEVLKSDNMFHIHRVPVQVKAKNELRIVFESALNYGYALAKERGHLSVANGDDSRAYVRKAQYHYGWDWGPVLMSCGPFKPIRCESYSANIVDVFVDANVDANLSAQVTVELEVNSAQPLAVEVELFSRLGRRLHPTK